jgi:dihydroorotase
MRFIAVLVFACAAVNGNAVAQQYDLLLAGGHVIDSKNNVDAVRDVAIAGGKIAAVEPHIDPQQAAKTVDVNGLYVTPGLVDIHVHVFAGTGEASSYSGDLSVYPDGFTLRNGVTTVADAGSSGWRNFPDFLTRIVNRSRTHVLAFLNIVGAGMRGPAFENNLADMNAEATANMAKEHPTVVVGVKTAHYAGPEWTPVERAVEAGRLANIPVMVDFGTNYPSRPLQQLLESKLRPGDIYTHMYSGLRDELLESGQVNPGMMAGRKRGVIFDVGHGGGSFLWRVAVPAIKQGFLPDSISTDLHVGSMNAGMKDMLNVMSKFLVLGVPLPDVIRMSTWNPAHEIQRESIGHLSVGAPADVAVLRLEKGRFGYADSNGARMDGDRKLNCELTVLDGRIVYDANAISKPDWRKLPPNYGPQTDGKRDARR